MSAGPLSEAEVKLLNEVVRLCKQDPALLHHPGLGPFRSYVESLGGSIPAARGPAASPGSPRPSAPAAAASEESEESDIELDNSGVIEPDDEKPQPMGDADKEVSEEDIEKSNEKKREAISAFAEGDYQKAIQMYTEAILLNPQSALLYAKRGQCYLQLGKPNACIRDCSRALDINPDSAAAHKFRGRAQRLLGRWEEAARDLRDACKIDFDEQADEWLREVTPNARKLEEHRRKYERKHAERELREKLERARRAKEEHARAASQSQDQPSGGATGDTGDFYKKMMNDPEIMQAFMDPEVSAAFQDVLTNPGNLAKYQSNPKIKAVINKLMSKFGGSMPAGGFPGMGGGFPGMPGGFPGAFPPPPPTGGAGAAPREDDVGLD
ncbi:putative protein FAM10A4 [Bacillus rossius redtenbacheri]|uniref:putative protein FAM10A4 n=1 Tax=Bacillus rossius redtenbacheri TaxID=93214 RepID=UPI002FDEB86F